MTSLRKSNSPDKRTLYSMNRIFFKYGVNKDMLIEKQLVFYQIKHLDETNIYQSGQTINFCCCIFRGIGLNFSIWESFSFKGRWPYFYQLRNIIKDITTSVILGHLVIFRLCNRRISRNKFQLNISNLLKFNSLMSICIIMHNQWDQQGCR